MSANTLKQIEAKNIVKNHVIISAGMGLIPVALFDIAALSANQHMMLRQLCEHFAVDFDGKRSKQLVLSLMAGSVPVVSVMGLSSISKLIPGVGTLGGSAGVALSAGAITYATGHTFIKHFNAGGDLDNFVAGQFSRIFDKELQKGRLFVSKLRRATAADDLV